MVNITYIFHSSFLVTTPECNVLFDFWKDPDGMLPSLIDKEKPFYVVVSHFHKDHYNPEIFRWAESFPEIHYILSKDTARRARHYFSPTSTHSGAHVDSSRLTVLKPGDSFSDSIISVRAFGSTDAGNSYLLSASRKRIFHAGDLNAWIWKDESTEQEIKDALKLFREKINPLKVYLQSDRDNADIDAALFPVDSRIGTEYWTGTKIFLREFRTAFFIPMHYGLGDEKEQLGRRLDAGRFELYANPDFSTIFAGPFQTYGTLSIP
ncbi:MAG: MBL fold metallo-hydrolase [Muribaculaceae bacterium]|nr:MBL fold metallo-hydrolase [Muribaculaceae bacterium]